MENRVKTAMLLAGSFHQSARLAGDFEQRLADWRRQASRPQVIMVDRFENGQWVTRRTVWNESEQRYAEAA